MGIAEGCAIGLARGGVACELLYSGYVVNLIQACCLCVVSLGSGSEVARLIV